MAKCYEISVWDTYRGDIIKKLWEATEEEYEDVLSDFEDEPFYEVVVDKEWEIESDDDQDTNEEPSHDHERI